MISKGLESNTNKAAKTQKYTPTNDGAPPSLGEGAKYSRPAITAAIGNQTKSSAFCIEAWRMFKSNKPGAWTPVHARGMASRTTEANIFNREEALMSHVGSSEVLSELSDGAFGQAGLVRSFPHGTPPGKGRYLEFKKFGEFLVGEGWGLS